MKRCLSKVIAVLFIIACIFAFSSCGHEHVYGEWSYAVLPTCTEAGVQSRMCLECEETEEMPADPLGHDEVKHEAVAATCTEKGNEEYVTCSRCDHTTLKEIEALGHKEVQCKGKDATCTEKGYEPYVFCERCEYRTFKETPALGHDEVKHERKQSTCLEKGWAAYVTCSRCDYTTFKELPKSGHQQAVLAAKQPTCTETGLTVGSYCKVCNVTIRAQETVAAKGHICKQGTCTVCGVEDYLEPSQYGSRIMYNSLASYSNGRDMQELYNRVEKAVKAFHFDYTTDLVLEDGGEWAYITDKINCKDLSLTKDDGYIVCTAFINDNPIYYWLTRPTLTYNKNTNKLSSVNLRVNEGYEKGAKRESINRQLAIVLKEFTQYAKDETSAYQKALCYYELVIKNTVYENAAVGKTSKEFYHCRNILGTFIHGRAVCVGYSLAFNTLLNFSEIECTTISGDNHQWSIVRMNDGEWYWFDPTWDDVPNMPLGYQTKYFCVNDTQPVNWRDMSAPGASATLGNSGFLDSHTPYAVGEEDVSRYDWSFWLPERSTVKYSSSDVIELRETFTVDGNTYALIGYGKVQLVKTGAMPSVFKVPEKVSYNGVEYTVVSIGAIMSSGLFDGSRPIGNGYSKNVILPKSVNYVMPRAITNESNAVNIYYEGTASDWRKVTIATKYLAKSKIYYYNETRPSVSGNYWHYVNGQPTPW